MRLKLPLIHGSSEKMTRKGEGRKHGGGGGSAGAGSGCVPQYDVSKASSQGKMERLCGGRQNVG